MPRHATVNPRTPDVGTCRFSLQVLAGALLSVCPLSAQAVVRAEGVAVSPSTVVSASALPSPTLRLSESLSAIGRSAPPRREAPSTRNDVAQPQLKSSTTLSMLGSPETLTDTGVRQDTPQPPRFAAAVSTAVSADYDDDDVGSDEPIGPPVKLGDMPGRMPPPLPGRPSPTTPVINAPGAPRAGSAGSNVAPCPPGIPCVTPFPSSPGSGSSSMLPQSLTGMSFEGSGGAPQGTDTDGTGLGWGVAPIRWSGSLGAQYMRQQAQGGSSWTSTTEIFSLRGASYIYQPWFAQVAANLSITGSQGSSSGGDGGGSSNDQRSILGGAMLNLFPQSRFPFLATFDRTDSQVNGSFVSSPYTNTRINLRQSYRSETGDQNGTVGYDRSVVEQRQAIGTDVVNAVYGDYSHAFENQTTQINGRFAQTERDYNGENSRLMNYYARHTYRYEENLNLETNTMFNDNRLRYLVNNRLTDSRGRYLQMNSSASWRPEDEDIPLSVTAGMMMLDASSDYNGESSSSQSVSLNSSANYAYNDNLMLMASGLMSKLNNKGASGGQDVLTNFGLAANYAGTPLTFGKYSYNWNAGSSVNRQAGGSFGDNIMTMLQASHSLGREIPLSDRQSVQLSFSQGVTQSSDQIIGNSTTLNHSAGGTWRFTAGDQTYGSVGLSASDNRTTGANEGNYQYIYLQLNGNGQLTPRSAFSMNMTVQWSMQDTQTLVVTNSPFLGTSAYYTDRNQRTSIFGSANYSHQRAFGVQGLRYNLSLNANTQMGDERLYGNAGANPDRYTWWLENRLDYAIGKLDLSASGTLTEVGGKKNAQVFFRATRNFGKF